jgi:hypothetical protein
MTGLWWAVGGVVGIALLVVWALTIWDMLRQRLGGGKTAAWLLIVILLPFIGSVLYWVLRKPTPEEVEQRLASDRALRESEARGPFDSTGLHR